MSQNHTELQVLRQRDWTDQELIRDGFRYYPCRKRLTMARILPENEAPKVMITPYDILIAEAGYYIAYQPGDTVKEKLEDYDPRPLLPSLFRKTYARWDEPNWQPTPPEQHLMSLGCRPYYKTVGVWAKRLKQDTWIQSIESMEPSQAPAGAWVCVGAAGEPWSVTDDWFRWRYVVEQYAAISGD